MCGRCCLTLSISQIQEICKYELKNGKEAAPYIRSEYNFGRKYEPSYNIAPSDITPVLVSSDHFESYERNSEVNENEMRFCIVPMLWGMIPFWHKGDYRKHGLTTNNCRLEHLLDSKLYKGPFMKGQRCIILCEGFYEWQTTQTAKSSNKPVYYIHMPQNVSIKMYDKSTWDEIRTLRLLKLAGIFDSWKDENGDLIYSYSIITFESNEVLSWLHHRTPAILETEQQAIDWIDFKRVPYKQALSVIKPPTHLSWYRVSNLVNSSRNKQASCNKPITDAKLEVRGNLLTNWLINGKRKEGLNSIAEKHDLDDSHSDAENIDKIKKRKT
ncbi:abasic site processing protein HMCES isoform X2 [Condylostylus longicornis]|uniref:abasic site processing protein HMCES isoform X2 n=1 Tax=Condylostylus longicornis TaxID=2530218 RepID=UPI00244DB8E8|nr:abasic site processing protein HMCES isoform X2 [Condylostylus longicornis]